MGVDMDVIELVQKQNPDFGREALLEAFVNACFSETTGELLGDVHEFNRVLNLLGRKRAILSASRHCCQHDGGQKAKIN